jgi:hypothetical protein
MLLHHLLVVTVLRWSGGECRWDYMVPLTGWVQVPLPDAQAGGRASHHPRHRLFCVSEIWNRHEELELRRHQ